MEWECPRGVAATWNLRTGATRWVTDDEPGVRHATLVLVKVGERLTFVAP